MEVFTPFMATYASISFLENLSPHIETRFVESPLYSLRRPTTFA